MDVKICIPLERAADVAIEVVGPKAAALGRLIGLGVAVPSGTCIPAAAYRRHLEQNGIAAAIHDELERLRAIPAEDLPTGRSASLASIRSRITQAPLDQSLVVEIEDLFHNHHFHPQRPTTVAVRSSAAGEDSPQHSFAGQHDTFLDVGGPAACVDAIKACWASLWSERAWEYREHNRFDHLGAEMAVIIQEMVGADLSGVVFTVDPMTGIRELLVIEACRGKCENLVSGRVAPERFLVEKARLRLVESEPGEQGRVLDARRAKSLARQAMKIESALGAPQDLEWAFSDGRFCFLQARPITALPEEADLQIWTSSNVGEVLPDVASPLTWSLVYRYVELLFGCFLKRLGLNFRDLDLVGLIAGRAYFNVIAAESLVRCFPSMGMRDMRDFFGGEQNQEGAELLKRLRFREAKIKFNAPGVLLRLPGLVLWVFIHTPDRSHIFIRRMKENSKQLWPSDMNGISDDRLLDLFKLMLSSIFEGDEGFAYAASGMSYYFNLVGICSKWLKDADGSLAGRLMSGMGGVDSAQSGLDMWHLAKLARTLPEVMQMLESGVDFEQLKSRLSGTPQGDQFLQSWDEFMQRHGHHARGEVDVMNPRWCETPDYVLDQVRGFAGAGAEKDPAAAYRRLAEERDQLIAGCRKALGNPFKRVLFDYVLKQASSGLVCRENLKSEAIRRVMYQRFILLELGRRLAGRKVFNSEDDIFFLDFDELEAVIHGKGPAGLAAIITRRRAEYRRNLTLDHPAVIIGRFDPDHFVPDPVKDPGKTMTGIGISPGIAQGPARVVARVDSTVKVQVGEILVAPFTDPGWTPYFMPAAGIVIDQGGMLSHGSIVARELGIPAVANVGPATRLIRDGQLVRVDGYRGTVIILE